MLDIAEAIFNMIAQCLATRNLTVKETFGGEDIIHVLEEFEGEQNVEVMTADDFLTRCYEVGVQELQPIQVACLMRVLGKPELSNAIRLNELEILMQNFVPQQQEVATEQNGPNKSAQDALAPKPEQQQ